MKKGFTLIEILAAVAIFSIFAAISTGFFVLSLKTQRKILALREIIDSSSYALEYMGRFLRMAKKDDLGGVDCLAGEKVNYETNLSGQEIKFRNYKDECQRFYLENNQIKEERGESVFPITPADLEVTSLTFKISGEQQQDNLQPKVTIRFEIQKKGQPATKMLIQTTVSQRKLDVTY